jgi:nucleoid-associated protein YgaU
MGLLEELAGAVLGGGRSSGVSSDQAGALVKGVLDSLGSDGDDAGVDGLKRRFQQGGAGDVFSSWLGNGANQSIGPDVLSQVLRGHPIESAPQRAGLGGAAGAAILAQLLPVLIDKLTPNGQVPARPQIREMSNQIARGDSPFARPEIALMSSGDKPKPDFSNVTGGASSTAPPPAAPKAAEPRTYTVVAGDNLSKIAKHFYGDANKWKKIFEANQDSIKNPDLIRVGQVLRIPE